MDNTQKDILKAHLRSSLMLAKNLTLCDKTDIELIDIVADQLLLRGVVVPPCKVGDVVYSKKGNPYVVEGIHYKNGRFLFGGSRDGIEGMPQKVWFENEIGKTVFLTKEEAEKALRGLKNEI